MKQHYGKLNFNNPSAILSSLTRDLADLQLPRTSSLRAVTFGSCFAINFANAIRSKGASATALVISEEANTPFANLVFLDYFLRGDNSLYAEYYREIKQHEWAKENERMELLDCFRNANTIVFTAGVGTRWVARDTGRTCLLPKVAEINNYTTVFPSINEQVGYLRDIYSCVREMNSTAPVIFSLSPVPLSRDDSYESVIQADCVSKSIMRAALHEFFREQRNNVYYYPTFEFFRWVGSHATRSFFGKDGKNRHPDTDLISFAIEFLLAGWAGGASQQ